MRTKFPSKKKSSMSSAIKKKAISSRKRWRDTTTIEKEKKQIFKTKTIKIIVFYDSAKHWTYKEVECYCIGDYAYHKHYKDGISVIHIKSKHLIRMCKNEKAAKYLVKKLNKQNEYKWKPKEFELERFTNWYFGVQICLSDTAAMMQVLEAEPNVHTQWAETHKMSGEDDIPF